MSRIPARVLRDQITVVRASSSTDRYGNETTSWDTAARHELWAWIEQASASESLDNRDQLASDWLAIVAPDADIEGRDRVEWDGKTFEVIGPPTPRDTLTGPHHIEATLRWIEG